MRTIITGLPYFTQILQPKFQRLNKKDRFVRLDTYYRIFDKFRFLILLPFTDVIYSVNGTVKKSNVADLALLFRKRVIFHWVGSDVLSARTDILARTFNQKYIDRVTHLSDAPWLTEELLSIGIKSKFIPIHPVDIGRSDKIPMPEKFSILSYVPEGKEKFYGIDSLITLAKKFPDVEIRIAGLSKYHEELPLNISLLGWVKNMNEEIRGSSVSIRIPEHDGLSYFVMESLANQRYVIYNKRFEPCIFADDDRSLQQCIMELKEKHDNHELMENIAGSEYVLSYFSESDVIGKILGIIEGSDP